MTRFERTANAFRNQVREVHVFESDSNRLGSIGGMSYNGVTFNVLKTADQDRWEVTPQGDKLHKECSIDVLKDDFTFWDNETWAGISGCGLYDEITTASSANKRPVVQSEGKSYQIFAMRDDTSDATVTLTARLVQ